MNRDRRTSDADRDEDLKRVARLAAAEVSKIASAAASQLTDTASQAARTLADLATQSVDLQYIKSSLGEIKVDLRAFRIGLDTKVAAETFKEGLDSKVSLEAFDPIRRLVYGQVALMLSAIVLGILALVMRKS